MYNGIKFDCSSDYVPLYLYKCVFTLSIEVKLLVVKCGVVPIAIDHTLSITHILGTREFPVGAGTEEQNPRDKFSQDYFRNHTTRVF